MSDRPAGTQAFDLGRPAPMSAPWPRVSGQLIRGLEMTALRATVTTRDCGAPSQRSDERPSQTVTASSRSTTRQIGRTSLSECLDMDAARRAALPANLERVADVPIRFVNAPHLTCLVAVNGAQVQILSARPFSRSQNPCSPAKAEGPSDQVDPLVGPAEGVQARGDVLRRVRDQGVAPDQPGEVDVHGVRPLHR
jgi:hypothetical protein